jgi:hypothetical protein
MCSLLTFTKAYGYHSTRLFVEGMHSTLGIDGGQHYTNGASFAVRYILVSFHRLVVVSNRIQ